MASLRTFATSSGRDLRIGIGHGEDDRIGRHALHHGGRQGAGHREAEEDIGALHRVGQRSRLGLDRMGRFPLVHAVGAALVDHALGVGEDDVLMRHAQRLDQFDAGDGRGTGAIADELRRFQSRGR